MQQEIPADKLSRVYSYDALGSIGLVPVGYALAGPIADVIGVRATLWGAAAIGVAVTLAVLLVRDVRTLERTRYAHPVTSQRRPANRHDISASRTTISAAIAAQTPTTPQSKASAAARRRADGESRDHRPGEERPVAGADQDPVEREDGTVQRLHQREEDPDRPARSTTSSSPVNARGSRGSSRSNAPANASPA